jgi:L-ascorbate metabolism protein UlaG (beta-lactamase superfamily)
MKSILILRRLLVVLLVFIIPANSIKSQNQNVTDMANNIHWLGQAAVKINAAGKVIYIDPYQLKKEDKADIVLITHSHHDHLSLSDIEKIITGASIIVAPADCHAKLQDLDVAEIKTVSPGQSLTLDNILVRAVPAYNVIKTNFHPKGNKWVGYVLTVDGVKIYHAGDTERIPEMKDFNCDIAMLPLGQTYTMNSVNEAADAAIDVQAKIAIPIHYGLYEGTDEDAEEFKRLLKDKVDVIIKPVE